MSSSQNNHTSKFIPILTEIIETSEQDDLDFSWDDEPKEEPIGAKQGAVNVFAGRLETPATPDVTPTEAAKPVQPHVFASARDTQRVEPPLNSTPLAHEPPYAPLHDESQPEPTAIKLNTDWQDRPSMPKAELFKNAKNNEPPEEGVASFFHEEEEEDMFSPLSRNPMAQNDQLRPSDLMLLALTERIASKVRVRVGKDLNAHIQSKIFPLLDGFADQLVKHLEIDLLKLIREGIAEATREELERLSQRNKK